MRLGIDIGGTKTAVGLIAPDGSVAAIRTDRSGRGPAGVIDVAARLALEVLADGHALGLLAGVRGAGDSTVEGVGACMPGLVDPATGHVRHAVNLEVEFLDLATELGAALGREVTVENDVKSAALGASRLVPGIAGQTLGYLNVGTGLASAIVRDGVVVRGIGGVAGEIGHLPFGGDVECTCGQVGCLETVASGSALGRLWPHPGAARANPFAAADRGDRCAAAAVDSVCSGIGLAIQVLALASGVEHVVIGGGLSGLGEPLGAAIRADLERRSRSSRIIESLDLPNRFELLSPAVPIAVLGAAWLGAGSFGGPRTRTSAAS